MTRTPLIYRELQAMADRYRALYGVDLTRIQLSPLNWDRLMREVGIEPGKRATDYVAVAFQHLTLVPMR